MAGLIQLDTRLSLAYDLYDPCELAADIGTDHAHLPAALLQRGRCQRMILTDLSESALRNARSEMNRLQLSDRVSLRLGDGLAPLTEACGVISVTGMGGRTIRDMLLAGQDKLQGAVLVLSAHTDLPLIRDAIRRIGYHLDREEPCLCAGRHYLVIRACAGPRPMTSREIRLGGPLFSADSHRLLPYLRHRREILLAQLHGLTSAVCPDEPLIAQIQEDIFIYTQFIRKGENFHDCTGSVYPDS